MSLKIYEYDEKIREILSKYLDEETGEISVFASEMLTKLEIEKETKCLSIAKYVKECELEVEALKQSEKSIYKRRKSLENKKDRIKTYLSTVVNNQKFSDSEIEISWRKSQVVEAENIDLIDDDFIIEKISKQIDKTTIKDLLKQGRKIKGASLVDKNNIQIK